MGRICVDILTPLLLYTNYLFSSLCITPFVHRVVLSASLLHPGPLPHISYPDDYPNNQDCKYRITVRPRKSSPNNLHGISAGVASIMRLRLCSGTMTDLHFCFLLVKLHELPLYNTYNVCDFL